jgi:hypothetical protein
MFSIKKGLTLPWLFVQHRPMINEENSTVTLQFHSSVLGETVAHCELMLTEDTRITADWLPHITDESFLKSLQNDLRYRFQQKIYGDLLGAVVNAQDVALKSVPHCGEAYNRIKAAFEPVIEKLRVAVPIHPRPSTDSVNI